MCCCDKRCDQKKLGEERVYFNSQLTVHHEGQPGQELRQRPRREECCSLACFSFPQRADPPALERQRPVCGLSYLIYQENASTAFTGPACGGVSHLNFLFSGDPSCGTLIKKQHKTNNNNNNNKKPYPGHLGTAGFSHSTCLPFLLPVTSVSRKETHQQGQGPRAWCPLLD